MLLSLIICCFSIFLLIPFFVGLMADSASLVSISFLSSSIFILFVVWLMLSLFFHCLALFLFFFFFLLSHCLLYTVQLAALTVRAYAWLSRRAERSDLLGGLRSTELTTALPSSDTSQCRVVVFGLSSAATMETTYRRQV